MNRVVVRQGSIVFIILHEILSMFLVFQLSKYFNIFMNNAGVLILSLDKDTYERLGLTGKPSAFQKKHRFSKYSKLVYVCTQYFTTLL